VASSAEVRRAVARAREAVKALGKATTAAAAAIRAAWRTSGGHARMFAQSREVRALSASARRAAQRAAVTARSAGATAGHRAAENWKQAVTRGRNLLSRADSSVKRSRGSRASTLGQPLHRRTR
jgi:hypothetical protein